MGLRAVHVPVLLDGDRLRFHVSRGNAVHAALAAGARALFVATGPHAYISPEYYGLEDRVPTWNYVAVELEGPVRRLGPEALDSPGRRSVAPSRRRGSRPSLPGPAPR